MVQRIDPDKIRDQQKKEILEHDFSKGPLLVLGGPGTGKTYNLINIIEKALLEGHKDNELFVTSFTKEAAGKLKKEIRDRTGIELESVRTLHSRAKGILHRYSKKVNLSENFRVLTLLEEKMLLKDIQHDFARIGRNYSIRELEKILMRNSKKDRSAMNEPRDPDFENIFNPIKQFYRAIDWYDVVYLANKILLENQEIKKVESSNYSFMFVDEYQDLNFAEQMFVQLVNNGRSYLMVVGDDDQSIYSGRFANPLGIAEFKKMYPTARINELKVSSRCPETILTAAHNLIKRNQRKARGCLLAHPEVKGRAGEGLIEFVKCGSNKKETSFLKEAILTLLEQGVEEKDILVLCSNKTIGKEYVSVLLETQNSFNIDNRLEGDKKLNLDDTIIEYLVNLSKNPQDNLALRIVLEKLLKIETRKILDCRALANKANTSLFEAIYSSGGQKILGNSVSRVISLFKPLQLLDESVEKKLGRVIKNYGNLKPAYLRWLKTKGGEEEEGFPIIPKEPSGVRFMTLHGSKGLQAKFVFLPCLEDEIIPGRWHGQDLEEQRRLLYVGIVRAQNAVVLSWAWNRTGASSHKAGKGKPIGRQRSRFLDEMGLDDVGPQDGIKMLQAYSKRWC